jgi:hypothetical protein
MPPQQRLWLNEEQRLFPGPHHSCEQDQEHPVGPDTGMPFHLSTQGDQALTRTSRFLPQAQTCSWKVGQLPKQERGYLVWPRRRALVDRLKTKACQPYNEREHSLQRRALPLGEDDRVNAFACTLALGNPQGARVMMRSSHRPILAGGYHK